MKVMFTCGGTGGHINPAVAVANLLRERRPDCQILFVGGAGGMECSLVPKAGYRLETLDPRSFRRGFGPKAIWHNLTGAYHTARSLGKARRLIRSFQPDVIVGTGGYASFPLLKEGAKLGVPTCVHESNAVPGLTTRMVADRVNQILVSFSESRSQYRHPERVEVVGMPVRQEFLYTKKEDARQTLGLDERPLIVSAWGSLGAREMNKVIADVFRLEQQAGCPYQHIHATGSYGWRWMPDYVKQRGQLDNNTVVTTVMSNFGLYKASDKKGIDYAKTAVGDKYVYEYMVNNGCRLGGEQSGHIIISKYATTGDGLLTSLKLMEVMLAKKKTLNQLCQGLTIYPQVLKNVKVRSKAEAQSDPEVQAAVEKVAKELGDTGRILVRESGTEPVIRVMVEADNLQTCHNYVEQVVDVICARGHARV